MLLLYLIQTTDKVPQLLFTFHYASTLSEIVIRTSYSAFYLHSTMLLLYRKLAGRWRLLLCIYIPLCFYFIALSPCCSHPASDSFTFHYASTLSIVGAEHIERIDAIYIPLCFYFINPCSLSRRYIDSIYIPLCFYFIYSWNASFCRTSIIYIPLCFYFIEEE